MLLRIKCMNGKEDAPRDSPQSRSAQIATSHYLGQVQTAQTRRHLPCGLTIRTVTGQAPVRFVNSALAATTTHDTN
jgi:hypothetical protein